MKPLAPSVTLDALTRYYQEGYNARKTLDDYVKQLLESPRLRCYMISEDSNLADVLNPNPSVFERLVEVLDDNNNESTKGSAICKFYKRKGN